MAPETTAPAVPSRRPPLYRILRHKNYRYFWIGVLCASVTTYMEQLASGWLIWELSHSTSVLGIAAFARAIPTIGLSLFIGSLSDRLERRQIMIVSQVTLVGATALMAWGIYAGWITVWLAILLSTVIGTFTLTNIMVRQAMIGDLLPPEEFMPGMFMYNAGVNATRAIGPLVAGTLIVTLGTGSAYLLQSIIWLAAVALTSGMARIVQHKATSTASILRSSGQGIAFVARSAALSAVVLALLLPVLLVSPFASLLPAFADMVAGVGARGLSFLLAAMGVGGLTASLINGQFLRERYRGLVILCVGLAFALTLILFAVVRWLPLLLLMTALWAGLQTTLLNTSNIVLQSYAPREMRGRMVGVYSLSTALIPVGSLFAGWLAATSSIPFTFATMGGLCVVALLAVLTRRPQLRTLQ